MTLRVAAIGDLHVGEGHRHPFRDLFAEISQAADVLALCGDLTNLGTLREAEILAEDLRSCSIPVLGVLGNHDHESGRGGEVMEMLEQGGMLPLEARTQVIDGVGFAGVKGFGGGFEGRMLGAFGEPAIKSFVGEAIGEAMRLENALRALAEEAERLVVVLHYAPIPATVEGEAREIYPFLGSSRLAETIDRFPVAAVFHGHAHHGVHRGQTPRGVPVYNCAQTVIKDGDRRWALVEV
ncbi:MAG: metallophosphoesterase [Alphaproteobacteria bacterium]|nr:metallophosphoesterase [Alphaproteobacteria bacterium]